MISVASGRSEVSMPLVQNTVSLFVTVCTLLQTDDVGPTKV
jgi:hypothetical protein